MHSRTFVNVMFVAALALVSGACSGGGINPNKPSDNPPPAGPATVKIQNWIFVRRAAVNLNYDKQFGPSSWRNNDNLVCVGATWSPDKQESSCLEIEVMVGVLNKLRVNDLAKYNGTEGSEYAGRDIYVNGRKLLPTIEGVSEYVCFKVDAAGNVTSTDQFGTPKG